MDRSPVIEPQEDKTSMKALSLQTGALQWTKEYSKSIGKGESPSILEQPEGLLVFHNGVELLAIVDVARSPFY